MDPYLQPAVGSGETFNLVNNPGIAAIGQPSFLQPAPVAQFATFQAPAAFAPSSEGGTFSDLLGSNGAHDYGGFPYPHLDFSTSTVGAMLDLMVYGATLGGIYAGVPGAVSGAVMGGVAGALLNPDQIGVPGVDPSAGSIGF